MWSFNVVGSLSLCCSHSSMYDLITELRYFEHAIDFILSLVLDV